MVREGRGQGKYGRVKQRSVWQLGESFDGLLDFLARTSAWALREISDASGWLAGHHGKNIDDSALTLEWHLAEGLRRHAAVQRTLCGVIDQ